MSYLCNLQLQSFRCYQQVRLEGLAPGIIVLSGANGAGKTNILEAITLLTPGRGLRSAKARYIQKNDQGDQVENNDPLVDVETPWAVSSSVQRGEQAIQLGTGWDPVKDKRLVRIQGESAKSQNALAEYLSCVWLTPQMDRLFLDGPSERRRFFDRLVYAFDRSHAGRITRYENAMRQRSKLLQDPYAKPETSWLAGLESQMAETGVAIAAARIECLQRLRSTFVTNMRHEGGFPTSEIFISGTVEELLQQETALKVEELMQYQLQQSREKDSETGGAASGPHKTDWKVIYKAKNQPAEYCSTGEQKALLIGIILSHAQLMALETQLPPVLLLDEVVAHLDKDRRALLFNLLQDLGGQVWMTGTDRSLFSGVEQAAQFFAVDEGRISAGYPSSKDRSGGLAA